jgi:hypothetical protein
LAGPWLQPSAMLPYPGFTSTVMSGCSWSTGCRKASRPLLGGSFPVSDATLLSPPADIVNDITSTLSADYGALLPIADTINALTTSLPAFDASLFTDQLEAGSLLGAIGDPIAADVALIPFALSWVQGRSRTR